MEHKDLKIHILVMTKDTNISTKKPKYLLMINRVSPSENPLLQSWLTVDSDVKFFLYSSSAAADPLDALIACVALPITISFGKLLLRCRQ